MASMDTVSPSMPLVLGFLADTGANAKTDVINKMRKILGVFLPVFIANNAIKSLNIRFTTFPRNFLSISLYIMMYFCSSAIHNFLPCLLLYSKNNLASKEKISSAKQEKIIAKIDKDFKKHLMRITANYLYTLEAKAEKLDMVRIRTVVDSVHGRMIRLMKGMLKSQHIKTEMQFSFS